MQKRVMNVLASVLTVICLMTTLLLYMYPHLHTFCEGLGSGQVTAGKSVLDLMKPDSYLLGDESENIMKGQLRFEIPPSVDASDIIITNDYVNQIIDVTIPSIDGTYFYTYPMVGNCDHIEDVFYDTVDDCGVIEIQMDSVYEPEITVDGEFLYLNFVDPHEIYDYIVVVDAGHGGGDVGAYISKVCEKDIDLAIVQELKELFDADEASIGVYYTRLDDTRVSLEKRANLANTLDADLFLSIHNNSTSSGRMSSINGTEVMYRVSDQSGESKAFADRCLSKLLERLGTNSKGLVAGDDIYIIRTSEVPVALVEVGFMTNQTELKNLQKKEYQKMTAEALHEAVLETLLQGEGENE